MGRKLPKSCQILARARGCRFDPPSSTGEGEGGPQTNAVFLVLGRSLFQTSTYNVLRSAVMWGRLEFAEKNALGGWSWTPFSPGHVEKCGCTEEYN